MPKLDDAQVAALLREVPGWEARDQQLHRTFTFRNFVTAMRFVNRMADVASRPTRFTVAIACRRVQILDTPSAVLRRTATIPRGQDRALARRATLGEVCRVLLGVAPSYPSTSTATLSASRVSLCADPSGAGRR
jgi:hypothetical protein